MSQNVMHEYANKSNGGRERVYRIDGKYYISSDFGKGFRGKVLVSRSQIENCMKATNAPQSVVNAILGGE